MPWCLVASSIPSALDPSRGKIESNCFFTKCMAILSAQAIKQALQNKDDMELRSKKDFYYVSVNSWSFVSFRAKSRTVRSKSVISASCLQKRGTQNNTKSISHLLALVEIQFSASDIFFPSTELQCTWYQFN